MSNGEVLRISVWFVLHSLAIILPVSLVAARVVLFICNTLRIEGAGDGVAPEWEELDKRMAAVNQRFGNAK